MITISLDEKGYFEDEQTEQFVLIAGIVFDDKGVEGETLREKERIKKYFELVCKESSAEYPIDLHLAVDRKNGNKIINKEKVRAVKTNYSRNLPDFLNRGVYSGPNGEEKVLLSGGMERQGEYYVYVMLKTKEGKEELRGENMSTLLNDQVASNLYIHMAQDSISHLLYYNTNLINQNDIYLDLPTRSFKWQKGQDHTEYDLLGHSTNDDNVTSITNGDVFRSLLAQEMLASKRKHRNIENLSVLPIDYKVRKGSNEESKQLFLFLADAVCSYFYGSYDKAGYITHLEKIADNLLGKKAMIFLYHSIETSFARAWNLAEEGDLFGAFSEIYDGLEVGGENFQARKLYEDVWLPDLVLRIKDTIDVGQYIVAIEKLGIAFKRNHHNPAKYVKIFSQLLKLRSSVKFDSDMEKAKLYELYDVGASIYNACGDTQAAEACLLKCREKEKNIGIEKAIRSRSKQVVALNDSFKYKSAIALALKNYKCYKKLMRMRKSFWGNEIGSKEYGIVCSQLGQCYGYQKNAKAKRYFLEALAKFGEGTPDYYITESYLCHYYLETNNEIEYRKASKELFGDKEELKDQLIYIMGEDTEHEQGRITFAYALFIYVKGLYKFYSNESKDIWGDLTGMITSAMEDKRKTKLFGVMYPWAQIYTYLVLLAMINGDNEKEKKYAKKLECCNKNKGIMQVIYNCCQLRLAQQIKDIDRQTKLISTIESAICEINPELRKRLNGTMDGIFRIITFMYQ